MVDLDHLELTDAELDAALLRIHVRHDELRVAQQRRRRFALGGTLVVVAALVVLGGMGVTGDDQPVRTPAQADAADPAGPRVPSGYVLRVGEGGTRTLERAERPAAPPPSSGATVGASSMTTRRAAVVAAEPVDGPAVRVTFDCGTDAEVIDTVRYRLDAGGLVVDAEISSSPAGPACPTGQAGPSIELPLAAALPAGTPVVAGSLHTP